MVIEYNDNFIDLVGLLESDEFQEIHTKPGIPVYKNTINVVRDSGVIDSLPFRVSEDVYNQVFRDTKKSSMMLHLSGSIRNYPVLIGEWEKKEPSMFANKAEFVKPKTFRNEVVLGGVLRDKPVFRITTMGREITDAFINVERVNGYVDSIHCIFWGGASRLARNLEPGANILVKGRWQSRKFKKETENGLEERISYEVSTSYITIINREDLR